MNLTGLMRIERRGKVYWYLRRKGQPLVRLPDPDEPGFLAAYEAAREAGPRPEPKSSLGSISAMCEAAMASERYLSKSAVYRATIRRHFEAIRAEVGDAPAKGLRDYMVSANVAKAASPVDRLKAWRLLCAFGKEARLLQTNPTLTVEAPERRKTEGHPPWTEDEVEAFRARWPIGTTKRLAFELLYWTGCRIGDAVKIGPGMVDRDGVLCFTQSKTGDPAFVPWTCGLPDYTEHMEDSRALLMDALEAAPSRHMTFLATAQGRPRSDKALGTMIREAAKEAGFEKSAHGLRKARAVALAEAGGTTHEISAWTGHKTLKEIEHYTQKANRRRAVMRREREQNNANHPAPECKTRSQVQQNKGS